MYDNPWGLTDRPFQLTPDPRFWFETATHRKAMAYLGYGLAQGEGFIVVTGEIGAGKTTLVGHLLGQLDRQRVTPVHIVSTAIEAPDLLRIVADQLGLAFAGLDKAALLVVDEAQALPVSALEELRMLSNFQAGGHALLQILLLGQPEFRDRLHGADCLEQLRQRIIAIHHLDPMAEGEVADYVAHRLQCVGWTGRPDFADDAFSALYQGSGGVPRRLNLLAARVMLAAAIEGTELIDAAVVRAVMQDLHADLPTGGIAMPMVEEEPAPAIASAEDEVDATIEAPRWLEVAEDAAVRSVASSTLFRHPGGGRGPDAPVDDAEDDASEPASIDPTPEPDDHPDHAVRIAALEQRIEDQDAALRRVLTLLVDWIEAEDTRVPAAQPVPIHGPAAWNDAA